MARIRSYALDENLTNNDYLLGNDANDSGVIATKRFQLPDLRQFVLQGTGLDLVRTTPRGFIPVITQRADADGNYTTERSGIQVRHVDVTPNINGGLANIVQPNTDTQFRALLDFTGNGQARLFFDGYDGEFYLPGFVGTTFTFQVMGSDTNYTATVTSYDGFINETDPQNNYYDYRDTFSVTTTAPLSGTMEINQMSADRGVLVIMRFDGNVELGNAEIENLVVSGTSAFGGNVAMGTDDNLVTLDLHGNLLIDEHDSGIIFGTPAPHITLTTDGTNLNLNSDPNTGVGEPEFRVNAPTQHNDNVVVDNSTLSFSADADPNNSITINNTGITQILETESRPVNAVLANPGPRPETPRTLQSLLIGDILYTIPDPSADVASVVPGITQELASTLNTSEANVTRWWYGRNRGTFATYEQDVNYTITSEIPSGNNVGAIVTNLAALPVPATSTSKEIDITGATTFDVTATVSGVSQTLNLSAEDFDYVLVNVFADVPPFQRLFFSVETFDAGNPFPSAGNQVPGAVQQIAGVFENRPTVGRGTITYSRLGAGTILFSAESVRINPLPTSDASANNAFLFIDQDDNNRLVSSTVDSIAGVQSIVNYEITETADDPNPTGVVLSINFDDIDGNPHITNNGGALTVDISGRLPLGNAGFVTAATSNRNLVIGHGYKLGNLPTTATDAERTLTLPSSTNLEFGDSIKLYNLSDLDSNGDNIASAIWRVQVPNFGAGGTDRIMRLPASQSQISLDVIQTMTFVWSGDPVVGWMVE